MTRSSKITIYKDQESKFTEEEKAESNNENTGYLTSKESEMGIEKKVIPEQK